MALMVDLEVVVGTTGKLLCGYQLTSYLWELDKFCLTCSFVAKGTASPIRGLTRSNRHLAIKTTDKALSILQRNELCDSITATQLVTQASAVCFSRDGNRMFIGNAYGAILSMNTEHWTLDATCTNAHHTPIVSLSSHPKKNWLLSLGSDMTLRIYDVTSCKTTFNVSMRNKPTYGGALYDVRWSPTGKYFSLSAKQVVDVLDEECKSVRMLQCGTRPTAVQWYTQNELLVAVKDCLLLFNVTNTLEPERYPLVESGRIVAFDCQDNFIATASSTGTIYLWQLASNRSQLLCSRKLDSMVNCLVLLKTRKKKTAYPIPQPMDKTLDAKFGRLSLGPQP